MRITSAVMAAAQVMAVEAYMLASSPAMAGTQYQGYGPGVRLTNFEIHAGCKDMQGRCMRERLSLNPRPITGILQSPKWNAEGGPRHRIFPRVLFRGQHFHSSGQQWMAARELSC